MEGPRFEFLKRSFSWGGDVKLTTQYEPGELLMEARDGDLCPGKMDDVDTASPHS